MADGFKELITPYNTSEFQAMVEGVRERHNAVHDQYATVAAELRQNLYKVKGVTGLFGLDIKIAARRVTKPLAHCAAMELATAQSLIRAWDLYNELFRGQRSQHTRGFDVDK